MELYCVKCGEKIRSDAAFCPHCGQRIGAADRDSGEWSGLGAFLAHGSLGMAKGLLYLLMGGVIFACGASGVGMFSVGAVLLYHFAAKGLCILPPVLASAIGVECLSGVPLAFGGITAVFIAVLFAVTVVSVIRAMRSLRKQTTPRAAA